MFSDVMDGRCRLILLQFLCLVWPSPPQITVDSFVLRRRSAVDDDPRLSDALYTVERFERPAPVSFLDYGDSYGALPQDYETDLPDDYDDVAEKLMDIINEEQNEEAAEQDYDEFGDRDYLDDDDETRSGPLLDDQEDFDDSDMKGMSSPAAKVLLDKSQLKEIFTNPNDQPVERDIDAKTIELSKKDVKKLFADTETDDTAALNDDGGESAEFEKNTPGNELQVPDVGSSNDASVRDKMVNVNEETLSPDDGNKLTKEWMMELIEADDADESSTSGDSGGKKSKRSMDAQSGEEEEEFEMEAKQRAVNLLKAYIELQEEENHHLTKALNLATLAQTQRTDRYVDDEVEQLRQAVDDEAAIETLRGMIRADEYADENIEDDNENREDQEEVE